MEDDQADSAELEVAGGVFVFAVDGIVDDGMAAGGEVGADLVLAPGEEVDEKS